VAHAREKFIEHHFFLWRPKKPNDYVVKVPAAVTVATPEMVAWAPRCTPAVLVRLEDPEIDEATPRTGLAVTVRFEDPCIVAPTGSGWKGGIKPPDDVPT